MSYFGGIKVGDCVWSVVYGWGEVCSSTNRLFDVKYHVVDSTYQEVWYNYDGIENDNNTRLQTLFWDEVKITPPPKANEDGEEGSEGFFCQRRLP